MQQNHALHAFIEDKVVHIALDIGGVQTSICYNFICFCVRDGLKLLIS